MSISARAGALAATLVLAAASGVLAQIAPGPGVNPRSVWSKPPERFETRVLATGLEDPWEVSFGPDGHLWVTERVGKRVLRIDPADGGVKVAVTIEATSSTGSR